MKQIITVCDVEACNRNNAQHFGIYKDTKLDGAGSSEHWYYAFDLCNDHKEHLLRAMLATYDKGNNYVLDRSNVLEILSDMKVKVKEE